MVCRGMRVRSLWSVAGLLLLGPSCSQVWEPLAEAPAAGTEAPPPPAVPIEEGEEELVVAGSLQDRYPYIRFVDNGSGLYTALVTVPQGAATSVVNTLKRFCSSLQGESPRASVEHVQDLGQAFRTASTKDPLPWNAQATFTSVEDVLVVQGGEEDLVEVLDFIDALWNNAPQIEIQAEILEVSDSDFFERGLTPIGDQVPLIQNLNGVGPDGTGPFLRAWGGAFPTATGQSLDGSGGAGGVAQLAILQNEFQFQAFIQLLQTLDKVDIVSRPRVVTRNGVVANLNSTEEFPVLEPKTIGTTGATQLNIRYRNIGVVLEVQPMLVGADTIHLAIRAEVSRLGRTITLATASTGDPIFSPIFNVRKATSSVSVRNGQAVVIGGLRGKETRITENKVPVLGDIPVLDLIFSSEQESEVETEVLFVITPIIKTRGATISPFGDIFDPFAESLAD